MSDTLPLEVKSRVDAHLDAVEKQLQTAGLDRTKRRGIVDDLETQILDMLAARHAQAVRLADVEEVLAHLDPPEAYVGEAPSSSGPRPRPTAIPRAQSSFSREAARAAWCIGVGFLGLAVLWFDMAVSTSVHAGQLLVPDALPPVWVLVLFVAVAVAGSVAAIAGPIVGTALGWIATKRIRSSDGAEYGLAYSVIAALFYPVVLIWVVTLMNSEWGMVTLYRRQGIRVVDHEYWMLLRTMWIFCAVLLTLVLVGLLQRFTRSPHMARRSVPVQRTLVAATR